MCRLWKRLSSYNSCMSKNIKTGIPRIHKNIRVSITAHHSPILRKKRWGLPGASWLENYYQPTLRLIKRSFLKKMYGGKGLKEDSRCQHEASMCTHVSMCTPWAHMSTSMCTHAQSHTETRPICMHVYNTRKIGTWTPKCHTAWLHKYERSRTGKFSEAGSWLLIAKLWQRVA